MLISFANNVEYAIEICDTTNVNNKIDLPRSVVENDEEWAKFISNLTMTRIRYLASPLHQKRQIKI